MRILLIGEFSRLHNSLKEGLVSLGHEVKIIANGDSFKNYPTDFSTKAIFCESKFMKLPRNAIHKFTNFDIATLEFGIRFYLHCNKLKNFDVVQLINEAPIQTIPVLERFLLNKVFRNNNKVFLLSCGVDYLVAKYLIEKKERYSIMNPYFENPSSKKEYSFILDFLKPNHIKTHNLIYKNSVGVIASDIDYLLPLKHNSKFLGMIPNPINVDTIEVLENPIDDKIIVFLGINTSTYFTKGISFFEEALKIIKSNYSDKIEVIITKNVPYSEYISKYNKAHIILDQVYGFDQGYNALEAMSKGKVVFTGAEKEFEDFYNLSEKVAVNALPNVQNIVDNLSFLIENPHEIKAIGNRARDFVEKHHNYILIAQKYIDVWKN